MSSLNKVLIIGRLGQDPDVRYTQNNTAVANLSIATSEKYKDNSGEMKENTEWHRVVLWARTAEIAQEYLKKGSLVFIEGSLQTRQWEDKEGKTQYTTEIKGYRLTMLESKGDGGGNHAPHPAESKGGGNPGGGNQPVSSNVDLNENFDDIDDDLPF